mgnify:CR=1 FL=1
MAFMVMTSDVLIHPDTTLSPTETFIGTDSPFIADVSILVVPDTIIPSTAICSPFLTLTVSSTFLL